MTGAGLTLSTILLHLARSDPSGRVAPGVRRPPGTVGGRGLLSSTWLPPGPRCSATRRSPRWSATRRSPGLWSTPGPATCTTSSWTTQALVITRPGQGHLPRRLRGHASTWPAPGPAPSPRTAASAPARSSIDCKHAAAVLIVARHLAAAAQLVERPGVGEDPGQAGRRAPRSGGRHRPAGLEFGVERIPAFRGYVGRQDLRIRPARLGKGGNWVRTGIGWDDLDFVARSYVPEHRELLLQFRAAAGAERPLRPAAQRLAVAAARSAAASGDCSTRPAAAGLSADHGQAAAWARSGPASRPRCSLDVAGATTGGLRARVRGSLVDGPAAGRPARSGVLGEPAHGVFWLQPGEAGDRGDLSWPGWTDAASAASCGSCSSRTRAIDGSGRGRGALLGRVRAVRCDRRSPLDLHRRVGPAAGRGPADAGPHGGRSSPTTACAWTGPCGLRAGERAASASRWTSRRARAQHPRPGRRAGRWSPGSELPYATPPTELAGREALRFVEQGAGARRPRRRRRRCPVRRGRLPAEHRRPRDPVTATPAAAGSADWFDLQVTVTMDGEEVPFDELFVALARGEEYLILETGVYFGLDRPEFAASAGADRGVQGAGRPSAGRSCRSTGSRPACGRTWSAWAPRSTSRCSGTGRPRAGRHRPRSSRSAAARDAAGRAAALPAGRLPLAQLPVEPPAGRDPGRRHGSGQDPAGAGADRPGQARPSRTAPPFLVVAPTSVVSNWAAEAARFAPGLHGRLPDRVDRRSAAARSSEVVAGADLVVTSYALLRIEFDQLAELELVRADPGRGPVREEPSGEDLPVRPPDRRPRSSWRSPAPRWRTA